MTYDTSTHPSHYPPRIMKLVTAPTTEPLTLAECKLFLRVDGSEEDAVISRLLTAARETAEGWMRKSLLTQTWQLDQHYQSGYAIKLALGVVQSITNVSVTSNGVTTALSNPQYELDVTNSCINLLGGIVADKVSIVFVAGYGDASDVPAAISQGILHQVAHLFHQREDGTAISSQAIALWKPFKEVLL